MRARSADASLLRSLDAGRVRGRVHSVFERAVNVVEDGALFTLASRDVDDAPDTIVVDAPGLGRTDIAVNDPAVAAGGTLRVGRITVLLKGARRWESTLPAYPRTGNALRANLRIVESRLGPQGDTGGATAQRHAEGAFARAAMAALAHRAGLLSLALSQGDLESARAHAKAMIGLGPGLTPSGDDFLVGLFAVLNIAGSPCHALRGVCPAVVTGARHSSHAISRAALPNAARGRVRESIAALIDQLMRGTTGSLVPSLDRVLAIGSTSGADIVAGIACGFDVNLQAGGPQPCR